MDAQIRRAQAHPKRTEILGYLTGKQGEEGADEAELAGSLELATAEVTYHLTVLCHADLVSQTDDLEPGGAERFVAAAAGN